MADRSESPATAFVFGDFRLIPRDRALLDGSTPVRLGSRALEILIVLVERAGEVVSKEEIFERVWPKTTVVEANLRVHLAALRKLLRDGLEGRRFLTTTPGRGYSFVAQVTRVAAETSSARAVETAVPVSVAERSLPRSLVHVVGQEEPISTIANALAQRRLITIVGPGGIGKTTVALAAATRLQADYADGAFFVDLAALTERRLVPSALAFALGMPTMSDDPVPNILSFLHGKRALLVIDNCEHLIESTALLAERLLADAQGVDILATSREPLRAYGEWVFRLPSLELPPASETPSASAALSYPAIELFVQRVVGNASAFELEDSHVPTVVELCRRLDGIPLAIELAAAGVHHLGLGDLARHLEGWLSREGGARRTANTRQRTLRATLDWSYELLSDDERALLRRLSVFRGSFTVAAAAAIASPDAAPSPSLLEDLSGLVFKSMLTADTTGDEVSYRLLEIVRAYANDLLAKSGERDEMVRRLAQHCIHVLGPSEVEWERQPTDAWLATYERATSDVRAALAWAFSPEGDQTLGRRLVVVSSTLFLQLSLLDEYRGWLERVLDSPPGEVQIEPQDEMRMRAALGVILLHTRGPSPAVASSFQRARELAETLGAGGFEIRALWGLFANAMFLGDFAYTHVLRERFGRLLAASVELKASPRTAILHDRMIAVSSHASGGQARARAHSTTVLARPLPQLRPTSGMRGRIVQGFPDHRLATRSIFARVCWLQGFADEAVGMARETVQEALELGDHVSLCYSLVFSGVPIALWVGARADAERSSAILLERSTRYSLRYWRSWGLAYDAVLGRRRGDQARLSSDENPLDVPLRLTQLELAVALGDECIELEDLSRLEAVRDEPALAGWCTPEILRLEGEVARRSSRGTDPNTAEHFFRQALESARARGELAWELRAATSLARLWTGSTRDSEGRDLLGKVYERFTEGFETADLACARDLLGR